MEVRRNQLQRHRTAKTEQHGQTLRGSYRSRNGTVLAHQQLVGVELDWLEHKRRVCL
jgi:hypothetical protein